MKNTLKLAVLMACAVPVASLPLTANAALVYTPPQAMVLTCNGTAPSVLHKTGSLATFACKNGETPQAVGVTSGLGGLLGLASGAAVLAASEAVPSLSLPGTAAGIPSSSGSGAGNGGSASKAGGGNGRSGNAGNGSGSGAGNGSGSGAGNGSGNGSGSGAGNGSSSGNGSGTSSGSGSGSSNASSGNGSGNTSTSENGSTPTVHPAAPSSGGGWLGSLVHAVRNVAGQVGSALINGVQPQTQQAGGMTVGGVPGTVVPYATSGSVTPATTPTPTPAIPPVVESATPPAWYQGSGTSGEYVQVSMSGRNAQAYQWYMAHVSDNGRMRVVLKISDVSLFGGVANPSIPGSVDHERLAMAGAFTVFLNNGGGWAADPYPFYVQTNTPANIDTISNFMSMKSAINQGYKKLWSIMLGNTGPRGFSPSRSGPLLPSNNLQFPTSAGINQGRITPLDYDGTSGSMGGYSQYFETTPEEYDCYYALDIFTHNLHAMKLFHGGFWVSSMPPLPKHLHILGGYGQYGMSPG